MKTSAPSATRSSRLRFILTAVALVLIVLALKTPAQDGGTKATESEAFIVDTVGLLQVGMKDEGIIAHWERRGWPANLPDMALVRIRDAGGGLELLARVRALMPSGTEFSRLAEIFENHEIKVAKDKLLRFFRPRDFIVEKLDLAGRRLAFHEHDHDLGGWFRRTSFFVYVYDAGQWREPNESALSRIAVDAMRRRLEAGGLEPGDLTEERLIHKRSNREFPFFSIMVRDPKNHMRGMVAASARVFEKVDLVVVMGFSARMDAVNPVIKDAKEKLGEMLSSIIVAR